MTMALESSVGMQIVRPNLWVPEPVDAALRGFNPTSELGKIIKTCMDHLPFALAMELLERVTSSVIIESSLSLTVYRGCAEHGPYNLHLCRCRRDIEGYGVVSRKVVTAHGVLHLANSMAATASYTVSNFKFHAIGTGTNAEAATDTALQTELTTEYNPNSTRATGSQAAAAASNNATYTTVGTNTLDSGTPAVTEHMVENSATTAAETIPTNQGLDRSVFSAINLVGANGDGLASTYVLTLTSGG